MPDLDMKSAELAIDRSPDGIAIDTALIKHFAERQRLGAGVVSIVTIAVAFILADAVPLEALAPWVIAQIGVAVLSMVRWKRLLQRNDLGEMSPALKLEAVAWKAVSGFLWGILAVFSFMYLPESLIFFAAITVAAMAVGAVSTMAAIPAAAMAFIALSFVPFIVLWLAGGDAPSITLGLLAILLLGMIVNSARISQNQILSALRAEMEHRRLNEEFHEARDEWLELSDASEAYVLFDKGDRLVAWNERFAELLQIPRKLLKRGTRRRELIASARKSVDVASGIVPIEQWMSQRTDPSTQETEATSVREYEGGMWLQRRLHRTKNGNLVVSFVDWTDLVRMENALRESEERYRLIAENSPDAIFVRVDDEVVYVNPAGVKMLGAKSEDDLLGTSMMALFHPSDHVSIVANRTHLSEKRSEPAPLVRGRMRRLDGTYVMTEGSGAQHFWQGKPAVVITRRDVTSQIEAEERLRESEARYRRIAELSPTAILIRIEDRIVYANPAAIKMFGAESEADLLYESAMSFIHPDDRHLVLNNQANIEGEVGQTAPTICVRQQRLDGTYFESEGAGAAFVWQGQPAVMIMVRDLSRGTEAETPLQATAG